MGGNLQFMIIVNANDNIWFVKEDIIESCKPACMGEKIRYIPCKLMKHINNKCICRMKLENY